MSAAELLTQVQSQGVRLTLNGDRIAFEGPRERVTPTLIEELRAHKAELLVLLKGDAEENLLNDAIERSGRFIGDGMTVEEADAHALAMIFGEADREATRAQLSRLPCPATEVLH